MRRLCFLILFFIPLAVAAQPSDFIILKKKDKTVHSYYAGTQIEFVTTASVYKNALINRIHNDSIYLQEFIVRQMPTQFGFYVIDTAGSFKYVYHYNQIKSIGKEQKGFNVSGSGSGLLGGGILLTVACGVVYIADRDKFSPALMGASAGLALAGYFLSKAGGKGIVIGKKQYRLEYIKLSPDLK